MSASSYLRTIELRIGTVVKVDPFPKARNPSYKIQVHFGKYGVRKTSAQLPLTYPEPESLVGKQVAAVCNFPKKNIAGYMSEFLTVGFPDSSKTVRLMNTRKEKFPNGQRIGIFHGEDTAEAEITFDQFSVAEICCVRVKEVLPGENGSTVLKVENSDNDNNTFEIRFPKTFKNDNLVGSFIVYSPKDNLPLFVDPGDGFYFLLGIDNEDQVAVGSKLY